MKLGVFDSGIGGLAIAKALQDTYPNATIMTVNDHENVPYGNKTAQEVTKLTDAAIQPLLAGSCNIIILACNTATALVIETLRARYPTQRFIGIEPMIKTASELTKTNTIAVFATPATLASQRYDRLVKKYSAHLTILEPDCSTWAYMIENHEVNQREIAKVVKAVCSRGADVIVLGCTHYLWIKDFITRTAKDHAQIIEPSEAIGRRVQQLLELR